MADTENKILYTWYVVVPGSEMLVRPQVTRSREQAALLVADALVDAPDTAIGVVTKTRLNELVSKLDQLEQVEMIGYAEDFPRPRVTLGLLPKHDAQDRDDDRGERQDQRSR